MSEEKKPRLELLESAGLYRIEVCSPVKEKVDQIEVCSPNLVATPCEPIERVRCLPDVWCSPRIRCLPTEICLPMTYPCLPVIGPCSPQYGPCGPWVEVPFQRMDEISAKVERLTSEIAALRKRLAK